MNEDAIIKELISNGVNVKYITNGRNMYDVYSRWLSYTSNYDKKIVDELSEKPAGMLSTDELGYLFNYKKQLELAKSFKRVYEDNCSKEDVLITFEYAKNNSLIELMISKLSKEELEYASEKLSYLNNKNDGEVCKIIKEELEQSDDMVDQYIMLVLQTKINLKSLKDLEEKIISRIDENSKIRIRSNYNASNVII